MVVAALFFTALLLMMAAVLSVIRARRLEQLAKVNKRLQQVAFLTEIDTFSKRTNTTVLDSLSRWLQRVGIGISPGMALLILLAVILIGLGIKAVWGMLAAAMWWALVGTVAVFIPQIRYSLTRPSAGWPPAAMWRAPSSWPRKTSRSPCAR